MLCPRAGLKSIAQGAKTIIPWYPIPHNCSRYPFYSTHIPSIHSRTTEHFIPFFRGTFRCLLCGPDIGMLLGCFFLSPYPNPFMSRKDSITEEKSHANARTSTMPRGGKNSEQHSSVLYQPLTCSNLSDSSVWSVYFSEGSAIKTTNTKSIRSVGREEMRKQCTSRNRIMGRRSRNAWFFFMVRRRNQWEVVSHEEITLSVRWILSTAHMRKRERVNASVWHWLLCDWISGLGGSVDGVVCFFLLL